MRLITALWPWPPASLLGGSRHGVGAQEKVNEIGNVTIEGNSKVDMFKSREGQGEHIPATSRSSRR
jgi:cytochrome c-type protein NapB